MWDTNLKFFYQIVQFIFFLKLVLLLGSGSRNQESGIRISAVLFCCVPVLPSRLPLCFGDMRPIKPKRSSAGKNNSSHISNQHQVTGLCQALGRRFFYQQTFFLCVCAFIINRHMPQLNTN